MTVEDEILRGKRGRSGSRKKFPTFCVSNDLERSSREMKMVQIICILMATLWITAVSDVLASDFSCGSKIITTGDYKYDVLRRCGEPSHVEVWERVRVKRDIEPGLFEVEMGLSRWLPFVKEIVTVEEWEYNWGPNRFIRYLRFENGRLVRITVGDYGY
jgi:hypothetical protein